MCGRLMCLLKAQLTLPAALSSAILLCLMFVITVHGSDQDMQSKTTLLKFGRIPVEKLNQHLRKRLLLPISADWSSPELLAVLTYQSIERC